MKVYSHTAEVLSSHFPSRPPIAAAEIHTDVVEELFLTDLPGVPSIDSI